MDSHTFIVRGVLDGGHDLELCPIPKETEENETEDSNKEDEHIDDTTLIQ